MRSLAVLITLLVALVPLSAAQGGDDDGTSSSESSSGSSTRSSTSTTTTGRPESTDPACPPGPDASPADRQACAERFCERNPQDPRCRDEPAPPVNGSKPDDDGDEPSSDDGPRPVERWCAAKADDDAQAERCEDYIEEFRDEAGDDDRHWVSFEVDEGNISLLNVTVAGRLVLRSLQLDPGHGEVTVERSGRLLRIGDNDTELTLHDDPAGLIHFKGADGSLTFTFPSGVHIEERGENTRIVDASGQAALLVTDNATWLGDATVRATSFASFHVPVRGEAAPDDPPKAVEARERVQDAIERRHVAAEVNLKPVEAAIAAAAPEEDDSIQVLTYDDVQVTVDESSLSDLDAPIRIEVSSELDEGRTIVLHVDAALLNSADPDDILLRYFDLHNQTDGSILETEVVLSMASSLTDVLDPTDDAGNPEYWVVEDAEGLQVLFSVPHWSAHAITVSSLSSVAGLPSVIAGLVLGVVGSVTAAAMLFWPRRRDEDDEF